MCPRAIARLRTISGTRSSISRPPASLSWLSNELNGCSELIARRFDRLLKSMSNTIEVQQHVQDLLILAVAAGRADGEERFAVLQHHRRRERRPRPLPPTSTFGLPDRDRTPASGSTAALPCRRRRSAAEQPSGARRRAEQVAVAVDDVDARRVAVSSGRLHSAGGGERVPRSLYEERSNERVAGQRPSGGARRPPPATRSRQRPLLLRGRRRQRDDRVSIWPMSSRLGLAISRPPRARVRRMSGFADDSYCSVALRSLIR